MLSDTFRKRLWHEATERVAYAVLDGAQNKSLLDWLFSADPPKFECLFAGELDPDIAEVAPYLVQLAPETRFTQELIEAGWDKNWGVLLVSSEELPVVWRHLRQHTLVYGPELEPMYFRFYDPRVLRMFLPTCDSTQLSDFFGCIDLFLSEAEDPAQAAADVWSLANGQLLRERVGVA